MRKINARPWSGLGSKVTPRNRRPINLGLVLGIALLCGVPAAAQLTGPTLVSALRDQFASQKSFRVEPLIDGVRLLDNNSGAEVFEVRQAGIQQVTISGVVGHLASDFSVPALRRLALFNFSSPVGTLIFDRETGIVRMEHYLNPQMMSLGTIAMVAVKFGETLQKQSELILQ